MKAEDLRELLCIAYQQASWIKRSTVDPSITKYEAWYRLGDLIMNLPPDKEVNETITQNAIKEFKHE